MKYEWKKNDKNMYLPKNIPALINVPSLPFFTISGKGNPNDKEFIDAVGVLYSLAYTIKMLPKKGVKVDNYYDYTVFPLEGVWDLSEEGRQKEYLDKNELVYTIMIRQPDFVTLEFANEIIEIVKNKKPNSLLDHVKFEKIEEGPCVQMLHLGSYDNESSTFEVMQQYCNQNNLKRISLTHREIYISDPRKVEASKLKTVLRFKVEKN